MTQDLQVGQKIAGQLTGYFSHQGCPYAHDIWGASFYQKVEVQTKEGAIKTWVPVSLAGPNKGSLPDLAGKTVQIDGTVEALSLYVGGDQPIGKQPVLTDFTLKVA
ncbi:MAG: hypothetical protein LRY54_03840 [Alphaproteobacteria bacterium]|nr:hypothetical protein [Alphaproteobacteria bacterium]